MLNGKSKHTVNQALYITQKDEPIEAVNWFLAMNEKHLHSELVDQDVLLLGGKNDASSQQNKALINARSVSTRTFTEDEHAGEHCQMGNIGLALEVMLKWINKF